MNSSVLFCFLFSLLSSHLLLCTCASSHNTPLSRKASAPTALRGMKFRDPCVPQTDPFQRLCGFDDLRVVTHVVNKDYVGVEVINNCKYCKAYNIELDCTPVMGQWVNCIQPANYPIAFQQKWTFGYRGKPTPLTITAADFGNCV